MPEHSIALTIADALVRIQDALQQSPLLYMAHNREVAELLHGLGDAQRKFEAIEHEEIDYEQA